MNTFGRIFRVSILGESHGECVGVLVDGCPAGVSLSEGDFEKDLARRRAGAKGTTARHEPDLARLMSGVHDGKTTGAPLLVLFRNQDVDSSTYRELRHRPRPGHGDLVMRQKFGGFADWRGSGHTSGRLTAALVAAGTIARRVMPKVKLAARILEAGGQSNVERAVAKAERDGDSIGGIVECRITGLPPGLGEPFFDSAESLLAHGAFAIPAIKAIEFGSGFASACMSGSEYADEIVDRRGRTRTNHAGGINAGVTNGNEILFRVAVRPPSTSAAELRTVDLRTGHSVRIVPRGRHDRCIALRIPVVLESVAAMVMADLLLLEQKLPRVIRRGAK